MSMFKVVTKMRVAFRRSFADGMIVVSCMLLWASQASCAGISKVYSWEFPVGDAYYYCKTTRDGQLLTAHDDGALLVAKLLKRDKELGQASVVTAGPLSGSIDPDFFPARGALKQFVFKRPTVLGAEFGLYSLVPGGSDTPAGVFTIPALIAYQVSYFSKNAGSLDVVAADSSNVTIHAQTYDRFFKPRADGTVVAHLYYSAQRAVNGIIVSNIALFQDNGRYLRVFNGLDPVNSLPRYHLYRVTSKSFKQVTNPSLVATLVEGKKGQPVILPRYKDGELYVYNKLKAETVSGPFAVPGVTAGDTIGQDWITQKPHRNFIQTVLIPGWPTGSPITDKILDQILLKLFGTTAVPGPLTVNRITLGVTSGGSFTLRSYAVNMGGAKEAVRSGAFAGTASCTVYGNTYVVVQTNGTGSIVSTVSTKNLKTTGTQQLESPTPMVSPDGFIIDDHAGLVERTVTVYKYSIR
jgi:hypothetical protein